MHILKSKEPVFPPLSLLDSVPPPPHSPFHSVNWCRPSSLHISVNKCEKCNTISMQFGSQGVNAILRGDYILLTSHWPAIYSIHQHVTNKAAAKRFLSSCRGEHWRVRGMKTTRGPGQLAEPLSSWEGHLTVFVTFKKNK